MILEEILEEISQLAFCSFPLNYAKQNDDAPTFTLDLYAS